MSKADELKKKMRTNPVVFSPRPSVAVKPIPDMVPDARQNSAETTHKVGPIVADQKPELELSALFAKIPKEDKRWLDHYRIDTGKELGEIITEAIQLLKKQS